MGTVYAVEFQVDESRVHVLRGNVFKISHRRIPPSSRLSFLWCRTEDTTMLQACVNPKELIEYFYSPQLQTDSPNLQHII